jgi:RimJ/RimL family protein N-acetyltransferase
MLALSACELRSPEDTDCERIWHWRNDERVRSRMRNDSAFTLAEHRAWFALARSRTDAWYRVFAYAGAPVGLFTAAEIDRAENRWEAGWYVGEPSAPRGAGTAMVLLGLRELFAARRPASVTAIIFDDNEYSLRLARRLGFRDVGPLRGERRPAHAFAIDERRFIEHASAASAHLFGADAVPTVADVR